MITAHQITAALKGRWHGSYGMASCPSHLDGKTPALKISDDPRKSDGIDLHCFAGCPWETVKSDLVRGGLLEGWRPGDGPSYPTYPKLKFADDKPDPQDNEHYDKAKEIWQATEPIENTLSVQQLFEIPVWCALGSRLDRVTIPDEVIEVQVFADNGAPGKEAAMKACDAFTAAGKRVAIRHPPEAFGDWNDTLPHWRERPVGDWE